MKTFMLKLCCCFLFFTASAAITKGKYKETKVFKETFDVAKDARLQLNNKYGNINIESWKKNTIEIEVQVISTGRDQEDVLERLEEVDIQISGNKSQVSASTGIEKKNTFFSWFNNNSASLRIDYIVKMPEKNLLELKNSYGDVFIDQLKGDVKIDVNYGDVKAGELWGENNYIELDYSSSSGSEFKFINSGTIDADYSTVEVGSSDVLYVDTDYTTLRLGEINQLKFDMDYGKIKLKKAYILTGETDYVNVHIEEVNVSLSLDMDYGSLVVDRVTADLKNLDLNADYTNVEIGIDPNLDFQFRVDLSYADLRCPRDVVYRKEIQKNSSRYYEGYMGNPEAKTNFKIDSDYGNVKLVLKQNK